MESLSGQLRSLREEITCLEEEKESELQEAEQELRLAHEEIQALRQAAEDAAAEHEGDVAILQEELCRLRAELARTESTREEYELEITTLRAEIQMKSGGRTESRVLTDVGVLQEELRQLRERCQILTEEYHSLQQSNGLLSEQLEELEAQRAVRAVESRQEPSPRKKMLTTGCQASEKELQVEMGLPKAREHQEDSEVEAALRQQLLGAEEQVQQMQGKCEELFTELQELQLQHQASQEEQSRLLEELRLCQDELHRLQNAQGPSATTQPQREELQKKLQELQQLYQASQEEQGQLLKVQEQLQKELHFCQEELQQLREIQVLSESNKNQELLHKLQELQQLNQANKAEQERLLEVQGLLRKELGLCQDELQQLKEAQALPFKSDSSPQDQEKVLLQMKLQELQQLYQTSQEERGRLLELQGQLQEELWLCQDELQQLRKSQTCPSDYLNNINKFEELLRKLQELQELFQVRQESLGQLQMEQGQLLEEQRWLQENQGSLQEELLRLRDAQGPKPESRCLIISKSQELMDKLQELHKLQLLYQASQEEQRRLVEDQGHLIEEQGQLQEELRICKELLKREECSSALSSQNHITTLSSSSSSNSSSSSSNSSHSKFEEILGKLRELQDLYQVSQEQQKWLQDEQERLLEERRQLKEELHLCQEEVKLFKIPNTPNPSLPRDLSSNNCSSSFESTEAADVIGQLMVKLQTLQALYQDSLKEQEQMKEELRQLVEVQEQLRRELQGCQEELQELRESKPVPALPESSNHHHLSSSNNSEVNPAREHRELQMKLQELQQLYQISQQEQGRLLEVQGQLQEELCFCQEELQQLKVLQASAGKGSVVISNKSEELHMLQVQYKASQEEQGQQLQDKGQPLQDELQQLKDTSLEPPNSPDAESNKPLSGQRLLALHFTASGCSQGVVPGEALSWSHRTVPRKPIPPPGDP
ncbi:coiled-coil domain-containing protein 136 isoform X2 [Ornithorhynchus anatinus]|uniref:coiled-coil domain-containing protein 136 isoform X2 n=1 Tax=Ornithorhynchus anatinus TaxID=9258 RepID=UPI0019D4AD9E|nr:coiled-coil domain-containing protein 136 isoform X2 [Ornithorhynchus anatinus]